MNLSDAQLEGLLRAAHEAEDFERDALRPVGRIWTAARVGLALAACLALCTAAVWLLAPGTGTVAPTGLATAPAVLAPPARTVVMAIAEDEAGQLACVGWADHCLTPGTTLADLDTGELESIGAALACSPTSPRVLIVGLEGPAASLPRSDAEALSIAGCFRTSASCHSNTFDEHSCANVVCAAPSVAVRIASLVR
ncbi:MAG: hypothetical protein ACKVS8_07310 [Phycisphaerales bacterium]